MNPTQLARRIERGAYDGILARLYTDERVGAHRQRIRDALDRYIDIFGAPEQGVRLFSAPGRTEIGGNHTDHQRGRVLAAAVDMDVLCVAAPNEDKVIRIQSEGYPRDEVFLHSLEAREEEKNQAVSLIRGIAARFEALGHRVGGFNAYTTTSVLKGSGLSSSAAFEVAVGTMLNHLFCDGVESAVEIAKTAQYAENVYFGKPSGLMDQTASAVGGCIAIDFEDEENPVIEQLSLDLKSARHALCVTDVKGDHANLTHEYAAIATEMGAVAALFGKTRLREVDEEAFRARIREARGRCGDRAVLRAMHFFEENERVENQARALQEGDFAGFLRMVTQSGRSSFCRLQNVFSCAKPQEQGISLALALSEFVLKEEGAFRIHGGGFGGTIQAFVPEHLLARYTGTMENLFGAGACHRLSIRPLGGVEISCLSNMP